jgi:hypothetical protein
LSEGVMSLNERGKSCKSSKGNRGEMHCVRVCSACFVRSVCKVAYLAEPAADKKRSETI